jgi:hypothetical protein
VVEAVRPYRIWVLTSTTAKPRKPNHHGKSIAKLRVASKFNVDQLSEQPLFATNPETALPLLSLIGQAQLSIEDLLGHLSRQFIEQLLVLSAQSVAGDQHLYHHKS